MKDEKVVSINGRQYDRETGLLLNQSIKKPLSSPKTPATGARGIHSGLQKSQTLVRRATKLPERLKNSSHKSIDISKSARISRFAPNPIIKNTAGLIAKSDDIAKQKLHPLMKKVNKSLEITRPQITKSLKEVKSEQIKKTVEETKTNNKPHKKRIKFSELKHRNLILAVSIVLGVGLISWVSYQFIPDISIRIAASQAGINASFPRYTPDGYHMDGPITYDDKSVVINYKQNAGEKTYSIRQSNSTWDSSAVQLNLADKWNSRNTIRAGGITIFTTNGYDKAAWVNHSILYTITSDAELDSDKITRIVTSM